MAGKTGTVKYAWMSTCASVNGKGKKGINETDLEELGH